MAISKYLLASGIPVDRILVETASIGDRIVLRLNRALVEKGIKGKTDPLELGMLTKLTDAEVAKLVGRGSRFRGILGTLEESGLSLIVTNPETKKTKTPEVFYGPVHIYSTKIRSAGVFASVYVLPSHQHTESTSIFGRFMEVWGAYCEIAQGYGSRNYPINYPSDPAFKGAIIGALKTYEIEYLSELLVKRKLGYPKEVKGSPAKLIKIIQHAYKDISGMRVANPPLCQAGGLATGWQKEFMNWYFKSTI